MISCQHAARGASAGGHPPSSIIAQEKRQHYISDSTWELIEARWKAKKKGNIEEDESLHKRIKTAVKKDKKKHVMETIREIEVQKEKWTGVKRMKKHLPLFTLSCVTKMEVGLKKEKEQKRSRIT